MVGMQDEDSIHGAGQYRADRLFLARGVEHHVQEVFRVSQVVAGIHHRLTHGVLVHHGCQGRHLGDQAHRRNLAVLRIGDVQGVVIEGREGADHTAHDRHGVRIAAGIACLWGPAHGGANEAALKMLEEIGTVDRVPEYVKKAKDKNSEFRLMGFGHRVYKNFDPRATVMKQTCDEVLAELGINDPQLELAMRLEELARKDPYFVERNLYPNVDFYSGIILKAIGIPTSMFTVIFAMARTVGWISHWQEMLSGPYKIGRPRQLYTGVTQRDIPDDRG